MKTDEPDSEPIAKADSAEAAHGKPDPATEVEIQQEHKRQVAKRQAEHLEFVKSLSFHTSSTFMDYLHGDVNEEEAELACQYEFARESKAMWEAAKKRDALQFANPNVEAEEIAVHVVSYHFQEWLTNPMLMVELLACESFPKNDWNELSQAERKRMTRFYRKKTPPLPIADVWSLEAFGVLDRLKAMAKASEPVIEDVPPGQKPKSVKRVPALLKQGDSDSEPGYYATFYLDFSRGETQLGNEFREWLKLPENKALFKKYHKSRRGKTGKPLDRLKDLAAWRLYREKDNDLEAANEFARQHRKQKKPFRDAKRKKERCGTEERCIPAHESDLFCDDAEASNAKSGAWEFLAEMMPREFAPPGRAMLKMCVALQKAVG